MAEDALRRLYENGLADVGLHFVEGDALWAAFVDFELATAGAPRVTPPHPPTHPPIPRTRSPTHPPTHAPAHYTPTH